MTIPGDFEVRNPEVEERLNDIGKTLRELCPPGYGFAFLLANFGKDGGMFYTANIDRHDVCNMMREFIQRSEPQ